MVRCAVLWCGVVRCGAVVRASEALGPCPKTVVEQTTAEWALLEQNPADHYFGMWQTTGTSMHV